SAAPPWAELCNAFGVTCRAAPRVLSCRPRCVHKASSLKPHGPVTSRRRHWLFLNQMVDNSAGAVILNYMVKQSSPSLDRVFHARARRAGRAMLSRLVGGERTLTELAAPLRMSFPAASKHVRVLERARLVRRRVVGRTHLCHIEGEPLARASQWLENY